MALAAAAGRAAAEHARELAALRSVKPRPLAKLYGSNGPTPEQASAHAEQLKAWARRYRSVIRLHKLALALANQR